MIYSINAVLRTFRCTTYRGNKELTSNTDWGLVIEVGNGHSHLEVESVREKGRVGEGGTAKEREVLGGKG